MKDTIAIPDGAILLARRAFENELWTKKPASWWKVWCFILGHVQHTEYKGLKRGQGYFNFSRLCTMHALGRDVTINNVEKFLKYARTAGMLSSQKATQGVLLSVNNYDHYQNLNNYLSDSVGSSGGRTGGTTLASGLSVDTPKEAEGLAETGAEQKRNRSGDINKYGKYDRPRPASLTKEDAWKNYSPRYLKELGMTEEVGVDAIRHRFLSKAERASESAVAGFIRRGQEDYQAAVAASKRQAARPSEEEIYPDVTKLRLEAERLRSQGMEVPQP